MPIHTLHSVRQQEDLAPQQLWAGTQTPQEQYWALNLLEQALDRPRPHDQLIHLVTQTPRDAYDLHRSIGQKAVIGEKERNIRTPFGHFKNWTPKIFNQLLAKQVSRATFEVQPLPAQLQSKSDTDNGDNPTEKKAKFFFTDRPYNKYTRTALPGYLLVPDAYHQRAPSVLVHTLVETSVDSEQYSLIYVQYVYRHTSNQSARLDRNYSALNIKDNETTKPQSSVCPLLTPTVLLFLILAIPWKELRSFLRRKNYGSFSDPQPSTPTLSLRIASFKSQATFVSKV